MAADQDSRWRPTTAHVRAIAAGLLGLLFAVVFNRADLFMLAVPFMLIATWGEATRPARRPTIRIAIDQRLIREGDEVTLTMEVTHPGADAVLTLLPDHPFWSLEGSKETRSGAATRFQYRYRALRWAHRPAPAPHPHVMSPWFAYGAIPRVTDAPSVVVTPRPDVFHPRAPMPHPRGLVGLDRSARRGTGSELESIHPFHVGDRLRLIHWPVSLRTGSLHVTAAYSDEESHVLVLVDNTTDIGSPETHWTLPTSLDLTMRAAAALVSHHLARGDRVSVRALGGPALRLPPTMTGRNWIQPTLVQLATCERVTRFDLQLGRVLSGIPGRVLVFVLSPLIHADVADAVTGHLMHRQAILVDTLPADIGPQEGGAAGLAWRIVRVHRDMVLDALADRGVPVVPWRGSDSLDVVLRSIGHRPRGLVRR